VRVTLTNMPRTPTQPLKVFTSSLMELGEQTVLKMVMSTTSKTTLTVSGKFINYRATGLGFLVNLAGINSI